MDAARRRLSAIGALLLAGCAATPGPRANAGANAGAVAELGATGRLRAAINFGKRQEFQLLRASVHQQLDAMLDREEARMEQEVKDTLRDLPVEQPHQHH